MIRLSRDSRLVKFAYMGFPPFAWPGEPVRTSLCALFWRCVGTLLLIALVGLMVGGIAVACWREPKTLIGLGGFASVFIIAAVVSTVADRVKAHRVAARQLVPEAIWAIKNRVCPIVEITDETP